MTNPYRSISALVLAAGRSSRMGRFKPLLPLGRSTVIQRAVDSFLRAGISDVRVIVGHNAEEIRPVLDGMGVTSIVNAHYDAGMFSSVKAGVESLEPLTESFFVLPTDNPLVKPHTVRALVRSYREYHPAVAYPCFGQERGHPPLISASLRQAILSWDATGGLSSLLDRYAESSLDIQVADQGTVMDIDTETEYHDALAYSLREDVPTPEECHAILAIHNVSREGVAHGHRVAEVAARLAGRINQAGGHLDLDLTIAAGLLHDLAKGQPDHAGRGAQILTEMGYEEVGRIVAAHMDIRVDRDRAPEEAEIVYLADKLVQGPRAIPLGERFGATFERFEGQPEALAAAKRRFADAKAIHEQVERIAGQKVEHILRETVAV